MPTPKPAASTGTRPKRSIARPAGSAASAPDASTIAGPSPSRPFTPTTRDQGQRGDGGRQLQHPRVGRQRGGEQGGVAADREIGRHAHSAQRYPGAWHHRVRGDDTTGPRAAHDRPHAVPPAARAQQAAARGRGAGRAGRRARRPRPPDRAVRARLRRAVGRAARPRPARRLPLGRRGQPHEGLVSAGHRRLGGRQRRARLLVPQDLQRRARSPAPTSRAAATATSA